MTTRDVEKDLLAHLVAAVSLLKSAQSMGKKPSMACGSDRMYRQMIKDYEASIERGRKHIFKETPDA